MPLSKFERYVMLVLTVVMIAIESTICQIKPEARGFALITLAVGLAARVAALALNPTLKLPKNRRTGYIAGAIVLAALAGCVIGFNPIGSVLPGWQGALIDFTIACTFTGGLAYLSDWAQRREGLHTGLVEDGHEEHVVEGSKRVRRKMLFAGKYRAKNGAEFACLLIENSRAN